MSPEVEGSDVQVHTTLKRNMMTVAQHTHTESFMQEYKINVLLVPIMKSGYSAADLRQMQSRINGGLDEAKHRMLLTGRAEFFWSPIVVEADEEIDLGDPLKLYQISHDMDRARRYWNTRSDPDALFAFGVVHAQAGNTDNATGLGLWPDFSEMLNLLILDWLDLLCDIGNALLEIFSLGLLGSDGGCHLEIPLYVGWATGDPNEIHQSEISRLFAHEFGHIMGLVKPGAPNHGTLNPWDPDYNISHSKYDELDGGSCGDSGVTYNQDKTFYSSPSVKPPVVNPLIQEQLFIFADRDRWFRG
jgi:hypothetical protein